MRKLKAKRELLETKGEIRASRFLRRCKSPPTSQGLFELHFCGCWWELSSFRPCIKENNLFSARKKKMSAYANSICKQTHSIQILVCEWGKCCVARSQQLLHEQNAEYQVPDDHFLIPLCLFQDGSMIKSGVFFSNMCILLFFHFLACQATPISSSLCFFRVLDPN